MLDDAAFKLACKAGVWRVLMRIASCCCAKEITMHQFTGVLIALTFLGTSLAQAASGPYVQIFGGPSFLPSYDIEIGDELGAIDPDYETGYTAGGALGYRLNDFLRLEAEVGYQRHELARGDATGLGQFISDINGSAEILSGMINGYVEGDFGLPLRPFLGFGGGVARVSLNELGLAVTTQPVPFLPPETIEVNDIVDDEDTVTAAQLMLGISYDFTQHLTAAVSYRFFAGFDAEFETAAVEGLIDAEEFGGDFYSHAGRFELRYQF
jgi:opacity protein-like surface antigen